MEVDMKRRNRFVSNSSSSSFMIYGVCLDREDVKKLLAKKMQFAPILEDIEKWGVYEGLSNHVKGLEITTGDPDSYGNYIYIGRSWDAINDNETKIQFQNRIKKTLTALFGEDIALSTHSEAWYDG